MDYNEKFEEITEDMESPETPEDAMMMNLSMQSYLSMQKAKTWEFARQILSILFVVTVLPVAVGAWAWTIRYLF